MNATAGLPYLQMARVSESLWNGCACVLRHVFASGVSRFKRETHDSFFIHIVLGTCHRNCGLRIVRTSARCACPRQIFLLYPNCSSRLGSSRARHDTRHVIAEGRVQFVQGLTSILRCTIGAVQLLNS